MIAPERQAHLSVREAIAHGDRLPFAAEALVGERLGLAEDAARDAEQQRPVATDTGVGAA